MEASSRNSEVIHAGIYYPKDSLKAATCVAGRDALYRFCAERGVPHERIGKLIVAVEEAELPGLERLHRAARELQIPPLNRWGLKEEKIPELAGHALRASSMRGNPVPLEQSTIEAVIRSAMGEGA